jgi:hypothetical protein
MYCTVGIEYVEMLLIIFLNVVLTASIQILYFLHSLHAQDFIKASARRIYICSLLYLLAYQVSSNVQLLST